MIFTETPFSGAFVVDLKPRRDERGFFARGFCAREFAAHGLHTDVVQQNISNNRHRGTLRGFHFQFPPAAETKFLRCTRGALFDVLVDLRPESPTFLQHFTVELTAANYRALYIPKRFGNAFQVMEDDTEATYAVGEFYTPDLESGIRFDDPRLGIAWPLPVSGISDKDRGWPLLVDTESEIRRRMSLPTAPRL